MSTDWDGRFLKLAAVVASWSRDPSTKVGAVITRPNRTIVSLGFNGFARGVHDADERLNYRTTRLLYTIHAEVNAILTAREPLDGLTIYTTRFPCAHCAGSIIQVGLKRVVIADTPENRVFMERWEEDITAAQSMLFEAFVATVLRDPDRAPL